MSGDISWIYNTGSLKRNQHGRVPDIIHTCKSSSPTALLAPAVAPMMEVVIK